MLTPVEKLTALTPLSQDLKEARAKEASAPEESPFGAIFRSAIDNVKESHYLLATGQLDNPAATMIAAYKHQTAVNMLVQLRNKALDAYSELSRINL